LNDLPDASVDDQQTDSERLKALELRIEKLLAQRERMQTRLDKANLRAERLLEAQDSDQSSQSELTEAVEDLKARNQKLTERREFFRAKLENARDQAILKSEAFERLQERLKKAAKREKTLREDIAAKVEAIKEQRAKVAALRDEVRGVRIKAEENIDRIRVAYLNQRLRNQEQNETRKRLAETNTALRERVRTTAQVNRANVLVGQLQKDALLQHRLAAAVAEEADFQPPALACAHNFDSLATGRWVAETYGARTIFDCVEHPEQALRTPGAIADFFRDNPDEAGLYEGYIRTKAAAYDAVLVTSPGHLSFFEGAADRRLILNTKRLRDQSPSERDIRQDLGAGPDDKIIVYLNNIYPQGGFEEFFEAAKAAPANHLYAVLGRVRDADAQALIDSEPPGPAGPPVRFLDLVPPNQIVTYIAGADCIASPFDPDHDGYRGLLPIRLFDAILAGVPIVAPDRGAMAELAAEHAIGATFAPGAMAEAIREAIAMKHAPAYAAALETAQETFDWRTEHRKLAERLDGFGLAPGAPAWIIANKPIANNSRIANLAHSMSMFDLKVRVYSASEPHAELRVDGVEYVNLFPEIER